MSQRNCRATIDEQRKGANCVERTITTTSNGHDVEVSERKLAELRHELDYVDAKLLDDVRARIEICAQIAALKKRNEIPMMQPGRMKFVHERARNYALGHHMSPEFLRALYDLLISEACRVEDLIIDGETDAPMARCPG